ncbi:MAG: glycosyltransferase, partial [Aquificaceae bacterium]|nr:glycosyltransferase [Aquificaceae bacterium]
MRVLSVVDGIGWGGTKEQVYLLARELSKRGIDIHVALSYQYDLMVEKLSPYNVKLHFFENHNKYARFNPLNYYRLWKIINQFDFDVVIANSPHTLDFVRVVFAFLRKPKRPKLIVVKRTYRKSNRLSIELKYKYADV